MSLFCQTKKGVKRKADTTTSCSVTPASTSVYSSSLESASTPLSAPPVVGRQDVLRPVKRLRKELPESDGQAQPRVGASVSPVTDVWKLCANILRDLMSKKCQVRHTQFVFVKFQFVLCRGMSFCVPHHVQSYNILVE